MKHWEREGAGEPCLRRHAGLYIERSAIRSLFFGLSPAIAPGRSQFVSLRRKDLPMTPNTSRPRSSRVVLGRRTASAVACVFALGTGGWGAAGHRAITLAAIESLPPEMPSWIREASLAERAAFESNEPDRWRATRLASLTHENGPDHYMDLEELTPRGMALRTLPPLRYEFVMALGRSEPAAEVPTPAATVTNISGAQGATSPPTTDPTAPVPGAPPRRGVTRTVVDEVGMVPYAIVEHHAKLAAAFRTLRILDALSDPARASQREAALANVVSEMGQLSHFVGDASQPLHTTIHHHGWVGENPNAYTTESGIHGRIDSEVVEHHGIDAKAIALALGASASSTSSIPADGAWNAALSLMERSFATVEPLYQMEKAGTLDAPEGKAFITDRMADGARTLAALYGSAWAASEPTPEQIETFVKYDESGR